MNFDGSDDLEDAIESVVSRVMSSVSTSMPGNIIAARPSLSNPNNYVADVFSGFLKVDSLTKSPYPQRILNVPILLPGKTNTFMIRPPMDPLSMAGLDVLLIVTNNFLADWKNTGGLVLPSDGRKFFHADAVAVLGLSPDLKGWPTPPKINTGQIKTADGTFLEIGNSTADLLRMMQDLISIVSQPNSAGGTLAAVPSVIRSSETLVTLAAKIASLANPDIKP